MYSKLQFYKWKNSMLQCVTFYLDHLHSIGAMNANFNPSEKIQEYKNIATV
jgi:hypothetical protein